MVNKVAARKVSICLATLLLWIGLCMEGARAGEKMGSHLRRLTKRSITWDNIDEASRNHYLKLRMKDGRLHVGVLLHAGPDLGNALVQLGAENIRRFGPIYAADVPVNELRRLAGRADVHHLKAVRKLRTTLDVSVPDQVGLELTRSAAPPWSNAGQGVIFGLVDTGLDPAHEDFKTADGTGSRILHIWDQNTGEECTNTQIQNGTCGHVDADGHGTHVTGIAAGNGRAPVDPDPAFQYVGVAPEASIIAVATTFYDDEILEGINYIFTKAHSQYNMPAVVNLSLGGQDGPHDGTDPFDVAMDALAGPGQVVVTSAGNDGDPACPIHQYAEHQGTDVNLPFKHHDPDGYAYYGDIGITIWHAPTDSYKVRVVSPLSGDVTCNPGRTCTRKIDPQLATIQIVNPNDNEVEYNGEKQIDIYLTGYTASGTWNIYLIEDTLGPQTPHWMHAWIYWDEVYTTRFENGDNQITISSPGSAKSIITVGAYTTKTQWTDIDGNPQEITGETVTDISTYSSRGPIRDGRFKPDITAPGTVIGSAMTGEVPLGDPDYLYRKYILPDSEHWILLGTSMASPHVAGLITLLLGADLGYTYTPAALKSIMAYSADRSYPVNTGQQNTWGYGKAKADSAVSRAAADSPRFTSADNLPVSAAVDNTLVAWGNGFTSDAGASERYLYQWQKFNGSFFENIPKANYRRLEPQAFSAGESVRVVATPYEHASGSPGYAGLLLGKSISAGQIIQSGSSFVSCTGGEMWRMVSIPTTDDAVIQATFMNPFWRWDEDQQTYFQLDETENLQRGMGYWVYVESNEGELHSSGTADSGDLVIELSYVGDIPQYRGRHLLGNPFNKPIYWENLYVSTDPGNFTLRVTDASDLIYNTYSADYDHTSTDYQYYDPDDFEQRDGKIFPWEGFWVTAKQHVYLKIPADQPVPASSGSYGDYPLPVASLNSTNSVTLKLTDRKGSRQPQDAWRLKISASSGPLRDAYNYIGVHPKSRLGYDPMDIPDAGTMSTYRHILLSMRHDDWEENAGTFCVDIRSSRDGRPHYWEMTAEARGLREPVTISWQKPPPGWKLVLIDIVADATVDMRGQSSYTYTPIGNEDRAFQISAWRKVESRLNRRVR